MRTAAWLGGVAVLGALGGALACLPHAGSRPEAGATSAGASSRPKWVHGVGYLEPASEVRRLVFKVNGVIDRCLVDVGSSVQKGDVLLALRNQEQQAALAMAEAERKLAAAERDKTLSGVNPFRIAALGSQLDLLEEQLRHVKRQEARARVLFPGRAISTEEYEKRCSELAQKEAARKQAAADLSYLEHFVTAEDRRLAEVRVELAQARVELRRVQLEDTLLRAPVDGTVLEVLKHEGDGARVADVEPVILFADISRVRIRGEIEERYVHAVRGGQKVLVTGRGLGTQCLPGTIVLTKRIMGKKTVFSRAAAERKDLEVVQVFIDLEEPLAAPVGLEVDIQVCVEE
jgi:multidrug resistance efflux pump